MQYHCTIARVRYNTESDGNQFLWRLVVDGEEHLVNSIRIEKPCTTTTDWLEDKQCFKHHVSVADCHVYIDDVTKDAILK